MDMHSFRHTSHPRRAPDWSTGDGSRAQLLQFLVEYDDLAFVRRARGVEQSWQQLLHQCSCRRFSMLETARIRLARIAALIDRDWSQLSRFFGDADAPMYLAGLHSHWRPALRCPISPNGSVRKTRRAAAEFLDSLQRFNQQWESYVLHLDLKQINRVRSDYNQYYVLEKACAFGSEYIGQADFKPLSPISAADVLKEFPLLRVPRLCVG